MTTKNMEDMFNSLGVVFPDNVKQNIEFNLEKNGYINKHYAFLVDTETNKILCYDFNVYFKTDSFPFSIHAEVQSIVKYYRSKSVNKNKKALIVVKLSKTGIVGNSRCCKQCMRFIRNNMNNMNIKKIYYSDKNNRLVELGKHDLIDTCFKYSKGYLFRNTQK